MEVALSVETDQAGALIAVRTTTDDAVTINGAAPISAPASARKCCSRLGPNVFLPLFPHCRGFPS